MSIVIERLQVCPVPLRSTLSPRDIDKRLPPLEDLYGPIKKDIEVFAWLTRHHQYYELKGEMFLNSDWKYENKVMPLCRMLTALT
jgi:hypothetical protein